MKKIIARIKGGMGNQLFCYAAARRLALINNAQLVIDHVSGFSRDFEYRRQYDLDRFEIPVRKATPRERLEPFERYQRGLLKWWSRKNTFAQRRYLEQEGYEFDERLLTVKVNGTLHLDGLWQGEGYFKDVEQTIRQDLRIIPPRDTPNLRLAEEIRGCTSVSLHVRWFDAPADASAHNMSVGYYQRAIDLIERSVESPRFFVFSDDPAAARMRLNLPHGSATFISHNQGDDMAYADLWLMTQCRHFITANSSFSWWGAWLGDGADKRVITPDLKIGGKAAWGFKGLIPDEWTRL